MEEFLICPICGAKARQLTKHITMKHKLSKAEILEKFPGIKLVSDATQKRQADALRKNWKDPEYARRCSSYWKSELHAKRKSEDMKALWQDPAWRENTLHYMRNINECQRKARSKTLHNIVSELWEDEEYKKKQFEQAMKNFSPNKAIEYNGTKFRSKLEASFAKLFTRLGIKYEYETIRIPYLDSEGKSHLYFLDFYLPDYETVIEVKPVKFLYEILESPKLPYALHSKYRLIILTERDISRKAISQLLPGAVSGKTVSDWSHHTDSNIKLLSVC